MCVMVCGWVFCVCVGVCSEGENVCESVVVCVCVCVFVCVNLSWCVCV